MSYTFAPAVTPATRPRVALVGGPGAGKIYTALTLATSWGGTVGVVDTVGSAARYAHLFPHVALPVRSFDPKDLPEIVAVASESGIDTLIVSTLSSYYSGTDGTLEQVGRLTSANGGRADAKNQAWDTVRPVEQAALDALATFSGNVIVTLRAKPEIIYERDESGTLGPRVVGTKADHRDTILFGFDVAIVMTGGTAVVVKTRAPALEHRAVHHPTGDFGREILDALAEGAVGDPFDARVVRAWALDDARTPDDLIDCADRLTRTGHDGVLLLDPAGQTVKLGDIVRTAYGHAVQAWAFDEARTPDEIRQCADRLTQTGADAIVLQGLTGPATLRVVVRDAWRAAKRRETGDDPAPQADAQDLGAAVLGAAA